MNERILEPDKTFVSNLKSGYEFRSLLSEVTDSLRICDKISIIFLLCDAPQAGLTIMEAILKNPHITVQNNIFYKWLQQELFFTEDWKNVMAELLTIIQNYKLTKILGFKKNESIKKFLPKHSLKTYNISCVRKVLYNLCEELKSDECKYLIALIEGREDSTDKLSNEYLEYKLLEWSEKEIINLENKKIIDLQALVKSLKCFNLNNIVHNIEVSVQKTNCQVLRAKSTFKLESELSEYYGIIDEKNLGLCVIVNEKNFTNNLFPKRWGSDKDAERLVEVFTAFGFVTKVHVDLTYEQFINILTFYAKTVEKTSSFFVLIILSHGSENIIFTSDSYSVDMNMIEMIFQAEVCPNLIGKPKIFIIQSCQGEKWQKVMQDSKPEIETDNFILSEIKQPLSLGPQKGDSMIAWSTVQGFASFRDRYNGSWYVQELCNELWKFGDALDLVEILTKVNKNLRSKVYSGQFMVPSLLLSLRAKIQFPNLNENFLRGRKLMLERLIFEKFFRDFIIDKSTSFELGLLLKGH